MSHNYQYLHSEVKGVFKDLKTPAFAAVPGDLLTEVRKYATIFDSQGVGVNESYCYFMVPDAKGTPNLFFTKMARKMNTSNLSYYTQTAGWKFTNVYSLPEGAALPSDDFNSIFDFAFYTEDEVDAYASGAEVAAFGSGNASENLAAPFSIAPEAMRAILHGVANRWSTGSAPVYIEVPGNEDYNAYVLRAVKQIYSYFPVAFKTNVGFVSYLDPKKAAQFLKIGIVFVPGTHAPQYTIRLDGSSPMAYKHFVDSTFGARLDAFMEHLAYLTDNAAREEFLKTVLMDAEYSASEDKISVINPVRYTVLGSGLSILKAQGTLEELFAQWLDFVENKKKYPRGIAHQISKRIQAELTPEKFAKVLHNGTSVAAPGSAEELNATLNKLYKLCGKRQEMYSILWDYTAEVLNQGVLSDEAVFDWLVSNQAVLDTYADKESCAALKDGFAKRNLERIWSDAEQKVRSASVQNRESYRSSSRTLAEKTVAAAQKYGDVSQWTGKILTIAEDRIAEDVAASLADLQKKNLSTADQYKASIRECEKLMAQLPAVGTYADSDRVMAMAEGHLVQLQESYNTLMNSVETLIASFEGSYFVAVDKYVARKHTLTDGQQQEVETELNRLRPAGFMNYCKTYVSQTGRKFDAAALLREHSAAGEIIRQDLLNMLSAPIEVRLDRKSAADIIGELEYYIVLARFVGVAKPVVVRAKLTGAGTAEMKAAVLKDIISLDLNQDGAAGIKEETVYTVINALYDNGAIEQSQQFAVLEMLQRCGYKTAADRFYSKANKFDGSEIREALRAEQQNEFEIKCTKCKKRTRQQQKLKTVLMAVFGGLCVVLVGVAVFLGLQWKGSIEQLDAALGRERNMASVIASQDAVIASEEEVIASQEAVIASQAADQQVIIVDENGVPIVTEPIPDSASVLEKRPPIEGTYESKFQ